jgi:hypothetical protein
MRRQFGAPELILSPVAPRKIFDCKSTIDTKSHPVLGPLISDLVFLCGISHVDREVIYVSSGPSRYPGLLAGLFPKLKFNLYHDHLEGEFDKLPSSVEFMEDRITNDDADGWCTYSSGTDLAFICNARVLKEAGPNEVRRTMQEQYGWVREGLFDCYSMDFRWCYDEPTLYYLSGTLSITPFGKSKSPSLRLNGTWKDAKGPSVIYNYAKIREIMYYHNSVIRPQTDLFAGEYKDTKIDHGYDWSAFMYAVRLYLETQKPLHRPRTDEEVFKFGKQLARLAK